MIRICETRAQNIGKWREDVTEDKKTKILVIEDNEVNLELVREILTFRGFEVIEAIAAEKGIELARTELPDLILMDLGLPGMNGLTATQKLKHDPQTQNIPVVALTSHAMRGDQELAMSCGSSDYITKPIDTRKFPQRIRSIIEEQPNKNQ